ncbi:MAG: HEAT repeat domain-containing protein [Isosphaeraceae bacterium]
MRTRRWWITPATCVLMAGAARADQAEIKKAFDEVLPNLGQEQAQQHWQEVCWQAGAPGREADRACASTLMAAKLGPETPAAARIWLLKQLERIGKGECVDAVAAALGDPDPLVRDAALRALTNNPDPSAGDRLRRALQAAREPAPRVALINALGFRADPANALALSSLYLGAAPPDRDPTVAAATARALGKIATPEAEAILRAMYARSSGPARLQFGDALARLATKMIRQGKAPQARSIYELLYRPDNPARLAGLEGLLRTADKDAPETILRVLAKADPDEHSIVIGHVQHLDTPAIGRLAKGLASLPTPSQVGLLAALGARRDRAALPAVVAAAGRDDSEVKLAALGALGGVGDASTVPLLLKASQEGGEAEKVARRSLETVFADGVDTALVDSLKSAPDNGRRALLIEILDNRRASAAVPAFMAALTADDGDVRRKAITALGHVAGDRDIPAMVQALLKIKDGGERDEAAGAVAAVCGRIADDARRADAVLAAYKGGSADDQVILLPLLGRIGGAEALEVVRGAAGAKEEPRRKAGQLALLNWPDSAVAEDVARLAETTGDTDMKTRAVQVLARIAVQPGPLSDDEKLALLTRGFKQAARDEEKRLLLDRAREVHTFAAVKFAAEHLGEPKLASQAIATVVDLLHRDEIRKPNQAEADKILDQVISLSKDKSLIERAKSFKKAG